jgi:class 3 adenylate cyclase/pimeloyl-ACP methyl ester carboxylesterase
MDLYEVLDQVVDLLRSRKRVTYRMLKRQFDLDEAALEDLKAELLFAHPQIADEDGRGLVWIQDTGPESASSAAAPSVAALGTRQDPAPRAYIPPHLAEKILLSRGTLEGERKQVTVLFADLKGSMELLADRDPEEAQQLLDPVLERMMEAVHRYEGTVNQVMGDGIMALFGAPIAHEDHAVRACYAALTMQHAVGRYAEEVRRQQGLDVQMRVGLHSGAVVVRAISNDLQLEYSAVGQTTHLAARMEQLARPGTTLITADTLRLVAGLVRVTALGPIPVKGLPAPVEVYELVGVSTLRGRFQAGVVRGLTRLVGRDQELAAVQQAGAGHGQVVALVGEAGVGKSRLVYEVVHAPQTQGWRVLESAAVSYGQATPYGPVIELLKHYVHVEDRDDVRTVRAKMTGQILTLDETLQDTIPALLSLLDALPADSAFMQLEPPQRRQRTLAALKRLLLRESQEQPLLLVCEDLHWIDAETQALLDTLVESLPTARLLLLVNSRPEYQHGWGSKTSYTQLRLDPLPPARAAAVLQALLGDDPSLESLTRLLVERTEGNPFFLEESVRTLVETGVLVGEPGAYRLAQALPTIQVPATVQAVLAARIDRLPAEEKRLLQTAAVIGTEVPLPLLQAIAERPEAAFHRGLAHLQAAEFLYETRLFPEREYTFKHALTQQVAYGSLVQERRRTLHRRIGELIEGLAADRRAEFFEALASHFERGEVWTKAVHYLLSAAGKAKEQNVYQGASQFCLRALEIAKRSDVSYEEKLRGVVLLGDLWSLMGDLERANESYDRALEESTDAGVRQWIVNKRHRPRTALRDGARIAFYEHGTGDPTLLFMAPVAYGLATSQRMIERLCQEFRIITIDPRGSGASDRLRRPYTVRDHMEDLRVVIEASWTGPVVGVGLSKGGSMFVQLAAAHPGLLKAMVLVGTSPDQETLRSIEEAPRHLAERGDLEGACRYWYAVTNSEPGLEHLADAWVKARLTLPADTLLNFYDPDPETDIVPLLARIGVPTVVLHGTEDRCIPFAAGRSLAAQIPGAQFYAFAGRGHLPVFTATAECCEVLRRFVRTGRVLEAAGSGP